MTAQISHRQYWAATLCEVIANCHPHDAAQIMAAALEDMETDGPILSFDNIRADANFWAECASPRELEAYLAACLRVLGRTALAIVVRKRLFVILWQSFPDADRCAFLAKADPSGAFRSGDNRGEAL